MLGIIERKIISRAMIWRTEISTKICTTSVRPTKQCCLFLRKSPKHTVRSFLLPWTVSVYRCLHSKESIRQNHVRRDATDPNKDTANKADLEAVIFDMDGVLCDSEEICRESAAQTFYELFTVRVPQSAFLPFQGMGDKVYFESVAEMYNVQHFNLSEVMSAFFVIYSKKLSDKNIAFPGATKLLNACMDTGLKIAVASSAERGKVLANLESIGVDRSKFDAVVSGDMITNLKPNPDIFLKTSELLNVHASNCLVIEDSLSGVTAAKAAGMACIGVTTTENKQKIVLAGADAVFEDISKISLSDISETMSSINSVCKISTPVQDFLSNPVKLPNGYKTDRRSVLQAVNLALGLTCIYLLSSRSKLLSFLSPRAIANTMSNPLRKVGNASSLNGSRVEAFKRYISDIESKGGGLAAKGFPSRADWLNSPPLSLDRDLKGKLVLLDFWTYCCINCMHVLPDLAYIEKKFSDQPVTVVGVHSAKFDNERDSGAIRNAVLRYNIEHPVVNDRNMVVWKELGVNSWPTLVLLSPKGQVLLTLPGEGHRQDLDDLISAGIEYYQPRGLLSGKPVPMALEKLKDNKLTQSTLRYPGKISTDFSGNRLFISDSNNHRIVATTLDGNFIEQIGGNGPKLLDGDYDTCCFNRPQGCCYDDQEDALYVADTENHALRRVNLKKKEVITVAGNGYQGRDYKGGGRGTSQQLSSPWDVEVKGRDVYIAIAGQHQIWKHNIDSGVSAVYSGNGYERNKNASDSQNTSWAQPSGLSLASLNSDWMFVADSESSSVRRMNTLSTQSEGIVGGDPLFADNLFRFGDVDGNFNQVLLQHPLAVLAVSEDMVFVADSYNHKLKMLNFKNNKCETVSGNGSAGFADGYVNKSKLSEPGGLARGPNNTIFVADTNNNLIRVFKMEDKSLSTLNIKNVPLPNVSPLEAEDNDINLVPAEVLVTEKATTSQGTISINVSFAKGFGFTKGAVSSYVSRIVSREEDDINEARIEPTQGAFKISESPNIQLQYKLGTDLKPQTRVQVDCKVYYCEEGKECLLKDIRVEIPFAQTLTSDRSNVHATILAG